MHGQAFEVGDLAVYPTRGGRQVEAIESRELGGTQANL